MRINGSFTSFLLALSLLLAMAAAFAPSNASSQYGPRSDYTLYFYADESLLYNSLKTGQIDVMMQELTPGQYADATVDPSLQLMPVTRFDIRAYSLNNNYTIQAYPGVRNPLNDVNFRTAIFHLVNRTHYTQVVCGGFAEPLPVPVNFNLRSWWNETTASYAQTELDFSLEKAKAALDAGGFNDTDEDGVRNYPVGWPGREAGTNLDGLTVIRRDDDLKRRDACNHLLAQMAAVGIPTNVPEVIAAQIANSIYVQKDYHIYTSGWSLSRYPTGLYGWFHSSQWIEGASSSNFHTGVNASGQPNYPDLDLALERLWYPSSLEDAKSACKEAQDLVIRKYKIFIPLWCSRALYAYRNLLGATNEQGYGPEYANSYLPLSAYRADNSSAPVRVGIKNPPTTMNIITASWSWEVSIFSRFMDSFMDFAPYDTFTDIPWAAQDWETGEWVDPDMGTTKTKVTYWMRKDQNWVEPVTGNILKPRNATDHPFSCWYWDSVGTAGWGYGGCRDIKYIVVENDYKLTVYFDIRNYWAWTSPWGRDLYPTAWKQTPLTTLKTAVFVEGVNMTTPGELGTPARTAGTPVEVVSIESNASGSIQPLTPDATPYLATHSGDYALKGSTASGPKIRIFTDLPDGTVLTAQYYARGDYSGLYAGNLPWQQTFLGSGLHYIGSCNPAPGGSVTFKANRNHWMETPPLGEVDFAWYYVDGPKPRNGYYIIDILDVIRCTAAYDSNGSGVPDPSWCSGADLASPSGIIDIFDVATITGKYEERFGEPPP